MALPSIAAAHSAVVVTPSDVTLIPPTRALYVGSGGNLTVLMANANADTGGDIASVTFSNVVAGILPIQVIKVLATGTTASSVLALY